MQNFSGLLAAILLLAFAVFAARAGADLLSEARQRRGVERVLYAEIVALRRQAAALAAEITRRYRTEEPFDARFFALWPLSDPLIYPATGASPLGRLRRGEFARIGYFHAQLADARARLARGRAAGGFEPTPYRILSCLVRSINDIEPWLRARRPTDGSEEDYPDLTDANNLVGHFEDLGQEPIAVAYCWADCGYA